MNELTEFNKFESELRLFKEKYDDIVYDLTVPEQEKAARADRLAIGKTISSLDRKHKELKAPLKEQVDLIDGQRKRIKDDLLNVQDKIKSQIQAHEDKIAAHAEMLQERVESIVNLGFFDDLMTPDSSVLTQILKQAKAIHVDDSYEHRKADATLAQIDVVKKMESMLAERLKYEADQAELEKLRLEKVAQERKDREETIRKEAEEKARAEEISKAKATVEVAERKQREAERAKLATQEAAVIKERLAKAEKERAVEAERERLEREAKTKEEEKLAVEREEEARKAKKVHQNRIHKAAVQSFVDNGHANAIDIVALIKDGKIDNVQIIY